MLSLYRRHLKNCPHTAKGRAWTKCGCPVWVDGDVNGNRVRESTGTRDWARAGRLAAKIEDAVSTGKTHKAIPEATAAFLAQCEIQPSTMRRYKRVMGNLEEFAAEHGATHVDDFSLELMDGLRRAHQLSAMTWSRDLQTLRQFFAFCADRKWIDDNPARRMKMPSDPKPKEREPYTSEELTRIIAACDAFGLYPYERIRAKALILLLRFYAPRISDVAMLERSRVKTGGLIDQIFFHAQKNGVPVWLPLYPEVRRSLECLPLPRGAASDCPYFFWKGTGSKENYIKTVTRTIEAVFRKSGVKDAVVHRFRHTLATEILIKGGSIEDAANILGDTPETIRKHYAKWSSAYQARTIEIMQRIHGTYKVHEKIPTANPVFSAVRMVAEVGVEPTR